jgi:uncharacterized membrane protein (UPF0127 family)
VIFESGARVRIDVADTDETRARGLMFRPPLSDAEGMLFVFDRPDRYAFWMKNVSAPLDILWVDQALRIVWIVEAAPPCDADDCPIYRPPRSALYVVEVAGGFVARHGITRGGRVTLSPPDAPSSRTATPNRC